jgi:hypothetical protein
MEKCMSVGVTNRISEELVNKIEAQAQPSGKAEVATDDTLVSDARMKIGWGGNSSRPLASRRAPRGRPPGGS